MATKTQDTLKQTTINVREFLTQLCRNSYYKLSENDNNLILTLARLALIDTKGKSINQIACSLLNTNIETLLSQHLSQLVNLNFEDYPNILEDIEVCENYGTMKCSLLSNLQSIKFNLLDSFDSVIKNIEKRLDLNRVGWSCSCILIKFNLRLAMTPTIYRSNNGYFTNRQIIQIIYDYYSFPLSHREKDSMIEEVENNYRLSKRSFDDYFIQQLEEPYENFIDSSHPRKWYIRRTPWISQLQIHPLHYIEGVNPYLSFKLSGS